MSVRRRRDGLPLMCWAGSSAINGLLMKRSRARGTEFDGVRDRAFARLLITTVLRRRGQIDEALDRYLKKNPDPKVRTFSAWAPRS